MDRDQRPASFLQDVRDVQRDVDQAQRSAGQRPPLTRASKGWVLGGEAPESEDLADGEVHLRSEGGSLVVRSQVGDIVVGDVPFGPSVPYPNPQTATPIGSSTPVLGADFSKMGADVDQVWQSLTALIDVLRSGRFPT